MRTMYTYSIKKNERCHWKMKNETWKKNGGEAINYDGKKWTNQTQLGNAPLHSNIAFRTQYYSPEYKRKRYEIKDCEDYQPCRMFLKEELMIIIDTKGTKPDEFRAKFETDQRDPILTKEQSIGSKIVKAFPKVKIIKQFFILNEKIDFYLARHILAIGVDKLGHLDRTEEDAIK